MLLSLLTLLAGPAAASTCTDILDYERKQVLLSESARAKAIAAFAPPLTEADRACQRSFVARHMGANAMNPPSLGGVRPGDPILWSEWKVLPGGIAYKPAFVGGVYGYLLAEVCNGKAHKLAFFFGVGNAPGGSEPLHAYVQNPSEQAKAAFNALAASLEASGYVGSDGGGTSIPSSLRMRFPSPGLSCHADWFVGVGGDAVRAACKEYRQSGTIYLLMFDGAPSDGSDYYGTNSVALELVAPSLGICKEGL